MDFDDAPKKGGGRQKGGTRRAARNKRTGRQSTIIKSPGMDDIYSDKERGNSNSPNAKPHYPQYENDSSDNSRFSTGAHMSDTEIAAMRGYRQKERREERKSKKQLEEERRGRVKNKLAESQRQRDAEAECIHLDGDDEEATTGRSCFDGVPLDRVNSFGERMIKQVMQTCGTEQDDYYDLADDEKHSGEGRRNNNKAFRGKNHEKSSMAHSLSPANRNQKRILQSERSQAGRSDNRGRGYGHSQRATGRVFASQSDDPLEEARSRQETNRHQRQSSSTASAHHDRRERDRGKGKNGTMTKKVGNAMISQLKKWGSGSTVTKREKQAGAALTRLTADDHRDQPSSGEKRKLSNRLNDRSSSKKRGGLEGSEHNAIDVDQDQSVCYVGEDDHPEEAVNITGTLEPCQQPTVSNVTQRHSSPKPGASSSLWENERTKGVLQGMTNFGFGKVSGGSGSKGRKASGKKQSKVIDIDESVEERKSVRRSSEGQVSRSSPQRRSSLGGSEHDSIDVDQNESIWATSTSPDKVGNDGADDDVDITDALAACEQPLSSNDIQQQSSAKAEKGSSMLNDIADLGLMKNPEGSGRKGHKKSAGKKQPKISDMNSYLKKTKKSDEIVSGPNSKGGRRNGESNSTTNNDMSRIPRKEKNGTSVSTRSVTQSKMAKQGMLLDGAAVKEGQGWLSTLKGPSKKPIQKAAPTRRRNGRKKSASHSITNYATATRRTRSNSKPKGRKDEVITIDSSSEEDDDSLNVSFDASVGAEEDFTRQKRAAGDRAVIDAVRIAVGKKVFKSKCELSFQFGTTDPYILFSFYEKSKKCEHSVYLQDDELKEVKYFIADENDESDDSMTVIVFRVTPTEKNNFVKYSSAYDQHDSEDSGKTHKRFISVEVRDSDVFKAMLYQMRQHPTLEVFCGEHSEIPLNDLEIYTKALMDDNQRDRDERSVASRTRSGRSGGKKTKKDSENKLLLVYPFDIDESALNEAASELKELGGDTLGVEPPGDDDGHDGPPDDVEMQDQSDGGDNSDGKSKTSRTHYVTIREDDKDRLSPGQFLNDTLVDFWMRWISRGVSHQPDSNVHFFTSHFMTTLKDDGPQAVSSWTAKKNINVFKKRLIFIPVNADLHWSLCAVVNPGLIKNWYNPKLPESEEHAFILFLDSLKMHSKNTYARHIRTWLNFEWKRLKRGKVDGKSDPFDKDSMPLSSPKIPYQDNGCDCGVFVCRYAYNLFTMRHQKFTWDDISERPPFKTLITTGPAFQFGMSDIARIREEIGTLIDNLSIHYLSMKEEERANKKAKRKEKITEEANSKESSVRASEVTTPNEASEKDDPHSETASTDLASDEDVGTEKGSKADTAEAAIKTDEDGDVVMDSSTLEAGNQSNTSEAAAEEVNEDDELLEGNTTESNDTSVEVEEREGVFMESFEEKENIELGSQNSAHEVAASQKLASKDKTSPLI